MIMEYVFFDFDRYFNMIDYNLTLLKLHTYNI